MERVVHTLQKGKQLVGELSKGTGCTTGVMAVLLSWLLQARKLAAENKSPLPKLVCVVRNSLAIPGIVAAINKLPYKTGVGLLGATRDQLCINPALSDSKRSQKDTRCQSLVECGGCSFYLGYRKHVSRIQEVYAPRNLDIEDWKKEGAAEAFCPYYANKASSQLAPVVVATAQQLAAVDADTLAELAHCGVVYIEDVDLLVQQLAEAEIGGFKLQLADFEVFEAELGKVQKVLAESDSTSEGGGLLGRVRSRLSNMRINFAASSAASNPTDTGAPRTGLQVHFGHQDSKHELCELVSDLLSLISSSQGSSTTSVKHTISTRKFFPSLEWLILQAIRLLSSDDVWLEVRSASQDKQQIALAQRSLSISGIFPTVTSIIATSEFLPAGNNRSAIPSISSVLHLSATEPSIGSVQLQSASQQLSLSLLPRPTSPLPSALPPLLSRLCAILPDNSLLILPSYSCLSQCRNIWKAQGVLASLETHKSVVFVVSHDIDAVEDKADPFDSVVVGEDTLQAQNTAGRMFAGRTEGRGAAVRRFLEAAKGKGALMVTCLQELKWIEQSLAGDEAVRAVILIGESVGSVVSTDLEKQRNGSYLARVIGKLVSHVHDYGLLIAMGDEFTSENTSHFLPKWISDLLADQQKYKVDQDGLLHKIKKFLEDMTKKANELKLDVDLKKGVGHQPSNGWALSLGLAESLKKLNSSTPTDQGVLTRKFIPLNPERKQMYERLKLDAQAQLNAPPAPVDPLEKTITKVKVNESSVVAAVNQPTPKPEAPAQTEIPVNRTVSMSSLFGPATSVQGDDGTSTVTYIPNVSNLRTANNTVSWSSILSLLEQPQNSTLYLSCVICYERDRVFLVSKCGHVCCKECWEIRLKELMECPVCKDRVRAKTLVTVVDLHK